MLSYQILTSSAPGGLVHYYKDGKDDYYQKEGEAISWQGVGADRLGLRQNISNATFKALLQGRPPGVAPDQIPQRIDQNRRLGIDLTFSAPKSVSLQAVIGGDERIFGAHDRAVAHALSLVEEMARTRKKIKGRVFSEDTKNLVIAKFRHETSRELDPQLHTHSVVMNLTQHSDGKWRALSNEKIIKNIKYLGMAYRSHLAQELKRLGYHIKLDREGLFELSHITREQIEEFSSRSSLIEKFLSTLQLNRETATGAQKQYATLKTRRRKLHPERDLLMQHYKDRAKDLGINFTPSKVIAGKDKNDDINTLPSREMAKRAVEYAVRHHTERQTVINEMALIESAISHGMGRTSLDHVLNEINKRRQSGALIQETPLYLPASDPNTQPYTEFGWRQKIIEKGHTPAEAKRSISRKIKNGELLAVEARYTTQAALTREKLILKIEKDGRNAISPVMPREIAEEQLQDAPLNEGQRGAAVMMLSTNNRISAIQGYAGVGKSHMLANTIPLLEDAGYNVKTLAPYGTQVKALQELGADSSTLASFLKASDKNISENSMVIVDEAGVIPTRQMEELLKIVEENNSRIILLGDTAQTQAIEAGKPFAQLQHHGMKTANMTEILRQKNPELLEAARQAALGRVQDALSNIENIHELEDPDDRYRAIADTYVALPDNERDKTIVVTGKNDARDKLTDAIRSSMELDMGGIDVTLLGRVDLTRVERRYSKNYEVGTIIQPEKNYFYVGLERHNTYRVIETELNGQNKLLVEDAEGNTFSFSPAVYSNLSVYKPKRTNIVVGENIRITRNDPGLDIANGDQFKITEISQSDIHLHGRGRDVVLPRSRELHIDHGYVTTAHSAQGLTCKNALLDLDAKSPTTTKDVFYVALTRATDRVDIYTDNKGKLEQAIERDLRDTSALEMIKNDEQAIERD